MASTVPIDAAGRVVIPSAVRRELALGAGAELEVTVEHGVIHLRPIARPQLARRGGRLVVTAPLAGPVPDHRELREERLEQLDDDRA